MYFQTWKQVASLPKPIKNLIQSVCGKITGHEASKTEWGYGGGKYADRWCRWCNKLISVPIEEVANEFDVPLHTINQINNGTAAADHKEET